jgi:hypothetical protein
MAMSRLRGRSRKLSDLYIDAKVPRAARATARVIVRVSDGEIVWAEHLGAAFGAGQLFKEFGFATPSKGPMLVGKSS